MSEVLVKQPAENRLFDVDLTDFKALRTSEVLTSVTSIVSDTSGLTFGTATISGKLIQFTIAGGIDGELHKITITFVTDSSPVVEVDVYLKVMEL